MFSSELQGLHKSIESHQKNFSCSIAEAIAVASIVTVRLCPMGRTSEIQDRSELLSMQRDGSSSGVRGRAGIGDPGHATHMLAWRSSSHQAWLNWLMMKPWCPSSIPGKITRVPWLAWHHGQEAKIGLRTLSCCGTQARQIVLRKPGAQQAPYTCTRMWDVCSPPSNDRDPMHILRIPLNCC